MYDTVKDTPPIAPARGAEGAEIVTVGGVVSGAADVVKVQE